MNVVAGVAMEIHAVPLSALFLEVVKKCNHKCPLSQYNNSFASNVVFYLCTLLNNRFLFTLKSAIFEDPCITLE